ncbi:MAG: entericidin EcnA/B family protein [Pacificimonas sp.]
MRKITTAAFASFVLVLSACNTIDGAQEDVESVADEVGEEL